MAHRKSNWYDEDDLDDGYSDDDYDDDYWGEEEEYQEDDGNAQDISTGARVMEHHPQQYVKQRGQPVTNSHPSREIEPHKKDAEPPTRHMKSMVLSDGSFSLDSGLKSLCDAAAAADRGSDGREVLNLVVLGHVDAGKSTLMGRMLYETGVVGDREIARAQKDAKAIGKGSFAWAWMLDERSEERSRGVTVDVAMARFETPHKQVTLLDAPGHRDFVPNMISGASQADAALVVIDGSDGGFESGMSAANAANPSGGGQTREHVQLAQSLGIDQVAVVVTKLDTCDDPKNRFEDIKTQMSDFMKRNGFHDVQKVQWTIAVGLTGDNLVKPPTSTCLSWYTGRTLLETIDAFVSAPRIVDAPIRLSVTEAYAKGSKNVVVSGKVHQGAMKSGTKVTLTPPGESGTVKAISSNNKAVTLARAGDTVDVTITVSDPALIHAGSVVCSPSHPVKLAKKFKAQIIVLDVVIPLLHGQNVTLHAHVARETGVISKILTLVDEHTGEVKKERPRCLLKGQAAVVEITPSLPMPLETFDDCKSLARIALRDGGRTLAVGKVLEIEEYKKM